MDRRPSRGPAREQYLRVPEVKYHLRRSVASDVSLPHKSIRMSKSPGADQQLPNPNPNPSPKPQQPAPPQASTGLASPAAATSPLCTTTSTPPTPRSPTRARAFTAGAPPTQVEAPPTQVGALPTPTGAPPSPPSASLRVPGQGEDARSRGHVKTSAPPVAAPFVVPPRSPRPSPRASPCLGRRTTTPSPTSESVAATLPPGTATVQAPPVGGERPQGEQSPTIVLTQHAESRTAPQAEPQPAPQAEPQIAPQAEPQTGPLSLGLDVLPESRPAQQEATTKQEPHKPDPSNPQVSTPQPPSPSSPHRESVHSTIPAGIQFTVTAPPKRDVAHVMEFFQEQEKSLQQNFLQLPKGRSSRKHRSPSPHSPGGAGPSLGLEHLDNLIKLMEQLTSLKDENCRLRKRCDYLESTKVLLQAKQDLSQDTSASPPGFMTLPSERHARRQHLHHLGRHPEHPMGRLSSEPGAHGPPETSARLLRPRPRLSSADELEYLEMLDSSSDQRPKRSKSALHKRSFSTGSLEVPSELVTDVHGVEGRKRIKSKTGRSIFGGKHSSSKQKSKSSKWARVKKVLTGQKLYEDLGTTIRSLREFGKSSHVRYSTSGLPGNPHEVSMTSTDLEPSYGVKAGEVGAGTPLSLAHTSPSGGTAGKEAGEGQSLTSDIWMGPPDWWEDYEAHKDSGTSTNSEVSSVIEVTTMYLGRKEALVSSALVSSALVSSASPGMMTASSLSTSPASPMTTSVTSASSMSSSGVATGGRSSQERYLSVESGLPRRQSSPSLSAKEGTTEEEEDLLEELTRVSSSPRMLHKSSSCKSADLDLSKDLSISPRESSKKFHKTAWGRVKDIIHTRKDSIKKKPKREKSSGFDSEETSEVDVEAMLEDHWRADAFAEGLLSRSTPKSSPMVVRQSSKSVSESPPGGGARPATAKVSLTSGTGQVDMAALLAGSVSDEFTRKMQEWEEKRARKTRSVRASMDDSDMASLDVSSASHEYNVRTIDLRDLRGKVPDSASEGPTPEESNTSMEVCGAPSVAVEEMQRKMTESFSRKMQEWERLKYRAVPGTSTNRDTSPEMERKGSKGKKEDRQKSKRSREEKEKEKWEKQRERDKQKVEREQVKLEKEKLRIEKERLRALEREAKLEKLKGRLSQSEMEPVFKNPVLSPLAEYKVTADFARKLHEWELMKGLSHDVSNSIYLEAQKLSMEHLRESQPLDSLARHEQARLALEGGVREQPQTGADTAGKSPSGASPSGTKLAPPVPPLSLQAYWESPEDGSPVEKDSELSLPDDDVTVTSVTEELLTKSNIASMERANSQLLTELQKKEMEYAAVQDEVVKVNEKLAKVREEHAREMARFHRELAQGSISSPVKLEVGELESTMGQLEEKIKVMENFGEELALSMESAAVGKWQSIEGEETVHNQLVELVDQMRGMLVQASQSEEQSQKSMALSNFENLYSQAMKLQVQMNNLRLSHLERNREIMMIKRQLLLQEVNNLLLQADITRRETELYQFQEAKRFASLKRWNTFGGTDRHKPHVQVDLGSAPGSKVLHRRDTTGQIPQASLNIPHLAEDVQACAASSSLSAPASPSAYAAAGDMPCASQSHSSTERSTDHVESHLLAPPISRGGAGAGYQRFSTTGRVGDGGAGGVYSNAPSRLAQQRVIIQLPAPGPYPGLRVQTSPSLTPSPYSSATPSPLSSPAMDTTPTSPMSPDDTLDLTLTTPEGDLGVTEQQEKVSGSSSSGQDKASPRRDKASESTTSEQKDRKQRTKARSSKPDFVTLCDSAPLHQEIEELKRVKSKVEKGSATLLAAAGPRAAPPPSPGASSGPASPPQTPDQFIPRQRSLDKPRLAKVAPIIDDDYSPDLTVMECTESPKLVLQTRGPSDSELGAVGGLELRPPVAGPRPEQLPPPSDQSRPAPRSPRSPVSKQKLLRRQREERETKLKDYKAISPKGSPIAARGKPPLPRQAIPAKQSPSASPAADKGPRSKSVGDMDPGAPDSPSTRTIQEAINKFEKRATVCETEDRPIELRKTPSPTLHLPRVGLVSRVKRLKPAAELLEESQRYRSGQSIYATRILQKYMPKDEKPPSGPSSPTNKENVSGSYVQSIVQRLSRESTPVGSAGSSRSNSNLSLHRSEAHPRAQSDLVSSIVRQLSGTSSGQESPKNGSDPLKDLTNEGHVKQLRQTFNGKSSPERTLSESNIEAPKEPVATSSAIKAQHRKSCEVAMVLAQASSPTEASYEFVVSSDSVDGGRAEEAVASGPNNHKSLPTLAPSPPSPIEQAARGRAATYCAPQEAEPSADEPDRSSSRRHDNGKRGKSKEKKSREKKGEAGRLLSSSLSPDRRGPRRRKMGTVGVLCQQSISFDLGVSLHTPRGEPPTHQPPPGADPKTRKPRSWDPSESARAEARAAAVGSHGDDGDDGRSTSPPGPSQSGASSAAGRSGRPVSSSSEGEMVPGSPTSGDKKKPRRFLDSSWLQKSKKFFKVSK